MYKKSCSCCGKLIDKEDAYYCENCGDYLCADCYKENDGICNECTDMFS